MTRIFLSGELRRSARTGHPGTLLVVKLVHALSMFLIFAVLTPAVWLHAQDSTPSLGDLARSLRKKKEDAAPAPTVIDNDNFSQVMDEAQAHKLSKSPVFSFDNGAKTFKISSPDVTCSLSFSAQATSLISDPFASRDLPASELAKLDGPAAINDGTLQVSVSNASDWNVREITVGLTIVRKAEPAAATLTPAKLTPESTPEVAPAEKRPDMTVLYHLKGAAAPSTTAVFQEVLGSPIGSDEEWHWAIVEAKGIPPQAPVTVPQPETAGAPTPPAGH